MRAEKKYVRNCGVLLCGVIGIATLSLYSFSKYDTREFSYIENMFKNWRLEMIQTINFSQPFSYDLKSRNENIIENSTVPNNSKIIETFSDYLFGFPWKELEESMQGVNETLHRQSLIDGLQQYAYQEPLVPVNQSCHAPPLINPEDILCQQFPDAFLPNRYKTPVKVAHAIQLGFDADSLEIHLNEIYDVVDHFFIIEATRIHCKTLRCLCSAGVPYSLFDYYVY